MDSKWRPVPLKREGFLIPNLIGTYLCRSKTVKEICYRILNCREMGLKVLKVTVAWGIRAWRHSIDRTANMYKPGYKVSLKVLKNVRFTRDDERLRNVRCFECKWRTMGPLETFGSKVLVGWRFRFRYMSIFARRRTTTDRPGHRESAVCWNERVNISD